MSISSSSNGGTSNEPGGKYGIIISLSLLSLFLFLLLPIFPAYCLMELHDGYSFFPLPDVCAFDGAAGEVAHVIRSVDGAVGIYAGN